MTQEVDFIPSEHVKARIRRKQLLRASVAVLAVFAVECGLLISVRGQAARVDASLIPLRESVAEMREWEARVEPLTLGLQEAHEHQSTLQRLAQGENWIGFLNALSESTNERIWLTDCRIRTEVNPGGDGETSETSRMVVSGVATSDIEIIEFMSSLADSPFVKSLRLETSRTSGVESRKGMIEFAMAGTLH